MDVFPRGVAILIGLGLLGTAYIIYLIMYIAHTEMKK
jgi:hypothetical protein